MSLFIIPDNFVRNGIKTIKDQIAVSRMYRSRPEPNLLQDLLGTVIVIPS
jgi:hypothetical protein